MGNLRKRFNAKARSNTSIQNQEVQDTGIEIDIKDKEKYDSCNALVLVPKKKGLKVAEKKQVHKKPLTKKQRKKLEKVIESKKKKLNRAELLKKISEVQASTDLLNHLTSTAEMQTYGTKRLFSESSQVTKRRKISNIAGIHKKQKMSDKSPLEENSDESSSESSGSSSDDEIEVEPVVSGKDEPAGGDKDEPADGDKDEPVVNENAIQNEAMLTEENKEKNSEKLHATHVPTVFVPVQRDPEIQAAREALPIYSEEQPIVEAIKENPVVIIHGETGSGKTTQVPQFLYEAGFTQNKMMIGVTEPRRIAAMSMACRVGNEMSMNNAVSYHVRYEKTVNAETKIKFMTDGVLLKELKQDFWLTRYSVIIIDEAHERSVYSDILIGLLSCIVRRRHLLKDKKLPPLKLIIMSATMCVEEFMENPRLFKEKPFLFKVSTRQYTVQAHFNKHTPEDYVEAAYHKVCKIHRQLPAGAILVFLTGENEITKLCSMLRETFPSESSSVYEKETSSVVPKKLKYRHKANQKDMSSIPDIDLDNFTIEPLDTEDLQHQLSEDEENPNETLKTQKFADGSPPLYVLPLYAVLPLKEQEKVFKPPPPGTRLCVVSTNIAETSITIPGLKYVIDSGRVKTKVYNNNSGGVSKFVITWCSKASANQRTGRAGRTEGGHCYRLYSSAVFENNFPDFSVPEILRNPADDVLLQMKALGIPKVVDFPFPSPPDVEALKNAEKRLILLGALDDIQNTDGRYKDSKEKEFSAPVNGFGIQMSRFPLSPRYSAMLLLSKKHECVPYVVSIICAMTVSEVFLSSTVPVSSDDTEDNESVKVVWEGIKKIGAGNGKYLRLGDAMVLLRAVALYEDSKNKVKFCIKNSIRHRAMVEIHKMGLQLLKEMNQAFTSLDLPLKLEMEYPSVEVVEMLRKIMAAGFVDHIARKLSPKECEKDKKLKNSYRCLELDEPVFIHPSSVLFSELPEYVVYQEINHTSKYYMKGVVEIESVWIPAIVPRLCDFSEPKEDPPPHYDSSKDKIYVAMDITVGRWQWEIKNAKIEMPKGLLKYQWFCFFLLDGQVCDFFSKYRTILGPSIVLKNWAMIYKPQYMHFLNALVSKEVDSLKSLKDVWMNDSKYLLKELIALLPSDKHLEVENKWPPKF